MTDVIGSFMVSVGGLYEGVFEDWISENLQPRMPIYRLTPLFCLSVKTKV